MTEDAGRKPLRAEHWKLQATTTRSLNLSDDMSRMSTERILKEKKLTFSLVKKTSWFSRKGRMENSQYKTSWDGEKDK